MSEPIPQAPAATRTPARPSHVVQAGFVLLHVLVLAAALLVAALPCPAGPQGRIDAQDKFNWDFGQYVVHATAVRTDFIPPPVAQRQGIERSTHRGMLNVVVEEKREDGTLEPIEARVEARATNLIGQVTEIGLEPRRERDTIYYIGTFPVDYREALDFHIEIQPPEVAEPLVVEFEKQFLTSTPAS